MGMVGARRPAMRPAFCYRIRDRDVLRVSSGSGRTAESRDADRQTGRYGMTRYTGVGVARKRACVLVATWGQRAGSLSFVTTRPWRGAVPAGRYHDYYAQALRACAMQPAQKHAQK